MPGDVNIAYVAALLADEARASMIVALGDDRAMTAGELARCASVKPSTASAHLARLVESGLLVVERQGRHHYFRLADLSIMDAIESLALFAPAKPIRSLRDSTIAGALRSARMCYNHLAGELGVAVTQALLEKRIVREVEDGYAVSEDGQRWLCEFGVMTPKKRSLLFAPHHIDWSERRHHLAGALGAALAKRLFEVGWVRRLPSSRAVRVTEEGRTELARVFGLHPTEEMCLHARPVAV
ncbi:MAG: winged helix-turn-helix transcriptional regulator [Ktedonobacteraceae bacterium]|nr:winged helix-turn-helix transcriptional regulator [Ktedonobacteraceae bacterium]MBO0790296.1 winged helix-turn-helix transcriptional regulator [Ktedonobacteraceae bacterium]